MEKQNEIKLLSDEAGKIQMFCLPECSLGPFAPARFCSGVGVGVPRKAPFGPVLCQQSALHTVARSVPLEPHSPRESAQTGRDRGKAERKMRPKCWHLGPSPRSSLGHRWKPWGSMCLAKVTISWRASFSAGSTGEEGRRAGGGPGACDDRLPSLARTRAENSPRSRCCRHPAG